MGGVETESDDGLSGPCRNEGLGGDGWPRGSAEVDKDNARDGNNPAVL